jgi:uncharacterized protein YoaH (UPF0181 family)
MEVILNLVAHMLDNCKTEDDIKQVAKELREMAKKDSKKNDD